ncbi:MAG TPA: hypothetical protein VLB29_18335 [Nocardioidaceae bacterium]|nr:hypothetical protein [Nocardioidaceae bacterium]
MRTNRARAAARARSSAASGSASMIFAATSDSSRPHGSDPVYGVVAASTNRA